MSEYKKIVAKVIVERLEKKTARKLPDKGLLCGGAVASTYLSLVDDKTYPINDVDIFVTDDPNKYINTYLKFQSLSDDVTYDYVMASQETYHVTDSLRDGLTNYIFVKLDGVSKGNPDLMILDGFDINCCQIGIDLSTYELYTTPAFDKFIENRELKIITTLTPSHTAIRIVKKSNELGVKLNKPQVFKELFPYFFARRISSSKKERTLFFGSKYKNMYFDYLVELLPFFSLITYAEHKINAWNNNGSEKLQYSENEPTDENIKKWLKVKLWVLEPRQNAFSTEWSDIVIFK